MSKKVSFAHKLSVDERIARGGIDFSDDLGLTEQSHRDSCDINVIMRNYEKTGLVPVIMDQVPRYEDFSMIDDYQSALNTVMAANDAFDQLPASIRKEFDNSPQKFLAALDDPSQTAKLLDLGVLVRPVVSESGVDSASNGVDPEAFKAKP